MYLNTLDPDRMCCLPRQWCQLRYKLCKGDVRSIEACTGFLRHPIDDPTSDKGFFDSKICYIINVSESHIGLPPAKCRHEHYAHNRPYGHGFPTVSGPSVVSKEMGGQQESNVAEDAFGNRRWRPGHRA